MDFLKTKKGKALLGTIGAGVATGIVALFPGGSEMIFDVLGAIAELFGAITENAPEAVEAAPETP